MKKTFKKLMAALLAVALLCAMAVPAFAVESAATGTGNGSITINNAVENMHYNFYRILDISTHTGTSTYTGVVYKVNNTWKDLVSDARWSDYLTVNADDTVFVKDAAKANSVFAEAFAKAAYTYATANTIPADYADKTPDSDHKVTVNPVTLGYYLVSSTGWDKSQEIICSLDTTKPNAVISEKNGKPTIEKKIIENSTPAGDNDVSIGDVVAFQTTVKVVDGNPYNYIVTDTMTDGLTFNSGSLSVTVNGSPFSGYTTSDITNHGFTIHFNNDGDKSVLNTNDVVVITYTATVNENAVIASSGNKNEAHLTYGKDSKDGGKSTTITYTWSFDLFKHNGASEALAGAVFQVLNSDGSRAAYFTYDSEKAVYKFAGWTTVAGAQNTFTTTSTGRIKFDGLDSGTYQLKEITAPEGYNLLKNPINFTIDGLSAEQAGTVHYDTNKTGTIDVLNNAGATLPSTGGMGTTLFYVIGGGLMVAAVVLLVTKKRMENK